MHLRCWMHLHWRVGRERGLKPRRRRREGRRRRMRVWQRHRSERRWCRGVQRYSHRDSKRDWMHSRCWVHVHWHCKRWRRWKRRLMQPPPPPLLVLPLLLLLLLLLPLLPLVLPI